VNYGLVHFGTMEAVIGAAMDRVVVRSLQFIEDSEDLVDAMGRALPQHHTHTHEHQHHQQNTPPKPPGGRALRGTRVRDDGGGHHARASSRRW
jgi:hypothetical protein